jgi:hypothetical protein
LVLIVPDRQRFDKPPFALKGLVLNVNHPDALVAGFGITRGITTEIGGFSLYAGTLTNCVVFNNGNAYYAGGVLYNGTITHCAFTRNKTADGGHGGGGRGGLLMINGTLQHSWITNNTDVTCVGGLEARGGSVRDCLIANNIQTRNGNNYGGGLYLIRTNPCA